MIFSISTEFSKKDTWYIFMLLEFQLSRKSNKRTVPCVLAMSMVFSLGSNLIQCKGVLYHIIFLWSKGNRSGQLVIQGGVHDVARWLLFFYFVRSFICFCLIFVCLFYSFCKRLRISMLERFDKEQIQQAEPIKVPTSLKYCLPHEPDEKQEAHGH